jgi:hypothetical protein
VAALQWACLKIVRLSLETSLDRRHPQIPLVVVLLLLLLLLVPVMVPVLGGVATRPVRRVQGVVEVEEVGKKFAQGEYGKCCERWRMQCPSLGASSSLRRRSHSSGA